MYYAQYDQMTDFETEYIFCKDNRLVLIEECLFIKASTAYAGAWALEAPPFSPGATAHLSLKQHSKSASFGSYLKKAILTSYKNVSVGYIKLKLHIYALGTSGTYFTSCKKGHNRSPLILFNHQKIRLHIQFASQVNIYVFIFFCSASNI